MLNKVFNFDQSIALDKKLSIKEMLLLDYIYKLFDPEDITNKAKTDKLYCRLTYSKLLKDLPILQVKERQLRNIIISLERKGFLERYSELRNQLYVFVYLDNLLKENSQNASENKI